VTTGAVSSIFFRSGILRLHASHHVPPAVAAHNGHPMVVVPGITTPAGAFDFAAARLAAGGRDVYVLDMRGRGLSERSPYGTHRAGDYAEDVLALIDHLGLEQPILVGHSLGARVVAAARAKVPGCAVAVVAIDPPMSGPGRRPYPIGVGQFVSGILGARTGRGDIEARQDYPTWTDEQIAARGKWLASCDEVAVVESYAWFHLEAFPPVWSEVEPPALLLYGEESPVVTEADVVELERVNPRAMTASVSRSGHMIPWDNLAEMLEKIEEFTVKFDETAI
jgi:N-formylmaleamate deformylase